MALVHIKDAPDLHGKRVFLRIDLNVPIVNGVISDDYRIRRSLPTITLLREAGAKIILASHIESKETNSLKEVSNYLLDLIPHTFIHDYPDETSRAIVNGLEEGGVVLLENLRQYDGEKNNDEQFAKDLASMADIYINEAFPVSHREHASIVGVPKFLPGYCGFVFFDEVRNLSRAFEPKKPFLFILGGAKFETKLPLMIKFYPQADRLFIGGALANDLLRAKGVSVGKSLVSEGNIDFSPFLESDKMLIPSDVIVDGGEVKSVEDIGADDVIVDAGPDTVRDLSLLIKEVKFIVWNGPLGNYEKGYSKATEDLALAIAQSGVDSIVGGGDTLAAIKKLGIETDFGFVSTGGGAMLDFLANETLPGIIALENSQK
ncbi:phosphoglycerate kinase [Candidatus Parcubacteria bacterium]|nr:phosphoglycerate kinase [Candidatus Parcubacteria bacterium]